MKLFLAAAAACLLFSSQQAQAYPASNALAYAITGTNTYQYNSYQTCAWLDSLTGYCAYSTSSSCFSGWTLNAYQLNGQKCCSKGGSGCRRELQDAQIQSARELASTDTQGLDEVFANGGQRTQYWGYVSSTARSPNAGRAQSAMARLDACVNWNTSDTYTVGSQISWNSCNSDCDTATNGYCNNTGLNDGVSTSNAACHDRCDCAIGAFNGKTCENM